jgi:tRNA(Ile2) C34 agmatinyltransferase TiaS
MKEQPDPEPNPTAAAPEEPMLYCPQCSRRLEERGCKLRCPRCGYYMSCSDYI